MQPAFLSTLPARGATPQRRHGDLLGQFLSTLPARGATARAAQEAEYYPVSIHAPREGSDGKV